MNRSVRADVFPAVLSVAPPDAPRASTISPPPASTGARMLEGVRVVVTLDAIYVFQDSPSGPQLIFSERLDAFTPPAGRPATMREARVPREASVTTDSGKTLAFRPSSGCGCGSRLRSFDPFAQITSYASTRDS